ncbi:MAG: DUF624 domain-containing protein [Lachnospiraceae bacterium]|jgi:uncharacterized membrane protein YesL|nr:DUF624 domain-containing protein [Lachnospiraceae bacterium]MCI1421957.1 DUF624 domain-containing protein [Lachnospiraceae bacterium]
MRITDKSRERAAVRAPCHFEMMGKIADFFGNEGGFTYWMSKVFDTLVLGLLWLLGCLPVFTAGASTAALYYAFTKSVKNDTGYAWREFFHGFRMNFRQGVVLWLVMLGVLLLSGGNFYIVWMKFTATNFHTLLLVIYGIAFYIAASMLMYLFPALSRFNMRTGWFFRFAASAALIHFPTTLMLLFISVMAVLLVWRLPFLVFLLPGLVCFLVSEFMERILNKYVPKSYREDRGDIDSM